MPFSDTVHRAIELADATRNYWDAELPKRHPAYPIVHPGEDSGPPPPEEVELESLLRSLSLEDLHKLLALVEIGQMTLKPSEFESRARALLREEPDFDWIIQQLMANVPLAAQLTDGLNELTARGIDIDNMEKAAA